MEEDKFYVVNEKVLPEIFLKVLKVKELIHTGKAKDVTEGVKEVGISRSAFYKYRNYIFPMTESINSRKITINVLVDHEAGSLSRVLDLIAANKGNILTINQDIPINLCANVTITVDIAGLSVPPKKLLYMIDALPSTIKTRLLYVE